MNVAVRSIHTGGNRTGQAVDADRVPLAILALTLLVFLIARPSVDIQSTSELVAPVDLVFREALPGHYAPYIPNSLLSDSRASRFPSLKESYHFNLVANSFGDIEFPKSGQFDARIRKIFEIVGVGEADIGTFVEVLLVEAKVSNVHPCFVSSLLIAPIAVNENAAHTLKLPLDTSSEMQSRSAMVGFSLSPANSAHLASHAFVATNYTGLLVESYEGQGNLVALAYWKGVAEMQYLMRDEMPLSPTDLDMLRAAIQIYNSCV